MSNGNHYQSGFGNQFSTEALEGALPIGQNSPQKPKFGLYAEQLTGSAFTAPRNNNLRSWLYRIRPSVQHSDYKVKKHSHWNQKLTFHHDPNQMRWDPIAFPKHAHNFIEGIVVWAGNGDASSHQGANISLYTANQSMDKEFFYSADSELLIVPQQGSLHFATEFGNLEVAPKEIIVIPRGVKFQVQLLEDKARGYLLENYGAPLRIPDLGPIGANGLANPRDFLYPVAAFHDRDEPCHLIAKYSGQLWQAELNHNPLDVVAWHGNYSPYKYNLTLFNTIGSISFDHPDPSIFTVLTSQTNSPGVANIDFVIFPDRWMVAEHTFRPPYFHRNIMSEFMGLIHGVYDAKPGEGFQPGGSSLHNCMSAHGPDKEGFDAGTVETLTPIKQQDTLAFMFESCLPWAVSSEAYHSKMRQKNYQACWNNLEKHFK